jgi:hypothetical protein
MDFTFRLMGGISVKVDASYHVSMKVYRLSQKRELGLHRSLKEFLSLGEKSLLQKVLSTECYLPLPFFILLENEGVSFQGNDNFSFSQ